MIILPFKIESIEVVNTGLFDSDVEGVEWIDSNRIGITNAIGCIGESDGGAQVYTSDEFEWSFIQRQADSEPYVLITLKKD